VTPAAGADAEALADRLAARPGVRGAARWAEVRGMITTGTRVLPIGLVGIDPARETGLSPLPEAVVSGGLGDLGADGGVFLGASLGARLGLFPGDRVTFLLPRAAGESVAPELLTAEVRGLFRLGAEPDHRVAFMHVDALVRERALATEQVRIALDDLYRAPVLAAGLRSSDDAAIASASDWTARYGELFQAVGMEKTMMGVLLGLIVAIAVFNIVASLAMVVDEKRGAIAILRTLGADRGRVVRIFVLQGALVGGLGVLVGTVAGVALAANVGELMALVERTFGFRLLAGTYFDVLPSELRAADVAWIAGGAFLMAVGGALYPALRAGRVDPAPALHGR
jgi:lipoprotein-releasing system permease protein